MGQTQSVCGHALEVDSTLSNIGILYIDVDMKPNPCMAGVINLRWVEKTTRRQVFFDKFYYFYVFLMFLEISLVHNFPKSGEAKTSNLMPFFIVIIHWIWIDELEEQQRPHPPEKKLLIVSLRIFLVVGIN